VKRETLSPNTPSKARQLTLAVGDHGSGLLERRNLQSLTKKLSLTPSRQSDFEQANISALAESSTHIFVTTTTYQKLANLTF
jgi:hypothetical protein